MTTDDENSYFRQIVREAVDSFKKGNYAYCFSDDQYKSINKIVPCKIEKEIDGIKYLRKETTNVKQVR